MPNTNSLSRRKFLKSASVAAGVMLTCGSIFTVEAAQSMDKNTQNHIHNNENEVFRGRMFFTDISEFETLSMASERIFPKDKNGPGAIELAVPYFIDNQLAAGYGYNAREYTSGPFFMGSSTQGYQGAMVKRDIFKQGLKALNEYSLTKYKKEFPQLTDLQMDSVLSSFEAGEVNFDRVSSSYFFGLLRAAVLAGVYADPIYNGNNKMEGWMLKEYPGAQMSYKNIIMDSTFQKIQPVSLSSMQ